MHGTDLLIDRIIRDGAFRDAFYLRPVDVANSAHLSVSPCELGALLAVPAAYFDEFARGLASNLPPRATWTDGAETHQRSH